MASIRKRNGKYQAQVRRQGFEPQARTFTKLADAKEWARTIEVRADRTELEPKRHDLKSTTLADLVVRYRDNETPRKKGAQTEAIMLNAFLRNPICKQPIGSLSRSDFAVFRDGRLARVKPASVRRQLMTIQAVLTKAMTDWDFPLKSNPLVGLKLPTGDNSRQRRLSGNEWTRLQNAARHDTNMLTLAAYYPENESGTKLDRPELFRLLADSKRGDILLTEQVDRLSRLRADDWERLKASIKERGVKVVALDLPTSHQMVSQGGDEFSGRMLEAVNGMMLDMLAAIARKDFEDRKRRAADGIAKAKAKGVYKGRPEDEERNAKIMELLREGWSYGRIGRPAPQAPASINASLTPYRGHPRQHPERWR